MDYAIVVVSVVGWLALWKRIGRLEARITRTEPMTEIGQRLSGLESLLTQEAQERRQRAEQIALLGPGGRERLRARLAELVNRRAARRGGA